MQDNYRESMQTYPVPDRLAGKPADSGLLLIHAVSKKALNTLPLSGVAIAPVEDATAMILAGSFKSGGLLSQPSGVVVFDALSPGRYRVVRIRTENVNMWETVELPSDADYEFERRPGSLVYLGQIEVRHPVGTATRTFTFNRNADREAAAWKMVLNRYPDSDWTSALGERAP
jgi:hypothetical protein